VGLVRYDLPTLLKKIEVILQMLIFVVLVRIKDVLALSDEVGTIFLGVESGT